MPASVGPLSEALPGRVQPAVQVRRHRRVRAKLLDSPTPAPYFFLAMLLRTSSPAFIEPCLPSPGEQPPTGPDWVHEIKHDG